MIKCGREMFMSGHKADPLNLHTCGIHHAHLRTAEGVYNKVAILTVNEPKRGVSGKKFRAN